MTLEEAFKELNKINEKFEFKVGQRFNTKSNTIFEIIDIRPNEFGTESVVLKDVTKLDDKDAWKQVITLSDFNDDVKKGIFTLCEALKELNKIDSGADGIKCCEDLNEAVAAIMNVPMLSKEELKKIDKSFGTVFIYKDEPEDDFRICYMKIDGSYSDPIELLTIKDFNMNTLLNVFDKINDRLKEFYNVYLDFDMYVVPSIKEYIDLIKKYPEDYENGQFEYTIEEDAFRWLRSAEDDTLIANKLYKNN